MIIRQGEGREGGALGALLKVTADVGAGGRVLVGPEE